jgi:hypothetical protein
LPEPQELFVEKLVAGGRCWSIRRDEREIGYAVIDGAGTLVELHVTPSELRWVAGAFAALDESCGARRILAKSFDATLMFVALRRPIEVRTTGLLYRVIADASFTADASIRVRAATRGDLTGDGGAVAWQWNHTATTQYGLTGSTTFRGTLGADGVIRGTATASNFPGLTGTFTEQRQ